MLLTIWLKMSQGTCPRDYKNDIYLATGAQSYERCEGTMRFVGTMVGGYMQAIKMTDVGATDTRIKFFDNQQRNDYRRTVLFFNRY